MSTYALRRRRWAALVGVVAVALSLVPPVPAEAAAPKRQVTVDQKSNLVNQVVRVSWKGFKPSSSTKLSQSTYYVVRVYQCRGHKPASAAECYGSSRYTYPGKTHGLVTPDGPSNAVTTVTLGNGTGQAEVEVRTKREASTLKCDAANACSLVVVPNDGDPKDPDNDFQWATQDHVDAPWAWAKRVVIPLGFSRTGEVCGLQDPDAAAAGSPGVRRLMEQWQPAMCQGAKPTDLDYTSISEPEGRSAFAGKRMDVGLTTLPDTNEPTRPFTYAPVGISGIAVAYRVDDAETGLPITNIKLTPRLVAKLITESYALAGVCASKAEPCNAAVRGNPAEIFQDPEFLKLNPGRLWSAMSWPTVVAGDNDLAYELTRWLAADAEAKAFVSGAPAPGGMHVNAHFKGLPLPITNFAARDPYPPFVHGYIPVLGLGEVARLLVTNRSNSESYTKDADGNYPKSPPRDVGERGLFAIVATSDAAALRFPVAEIRNPAGRFVKPTEAAMNASLTGMTAGKDKITHLVDHNHKNAAAYPMTMVHYAEVPTGGMAKSKAEKIARFLDHAAGAGQTPGLNPGQLPPGYVPLPAAMRAQTRKAAAEVRAQKGKLPGGGSAGSGRSPTKLNQSPNVPKAGASPGVSLPVVAGPAPMGGRLSSALSSLVRWLLPVLVGAGLAAGLLGGALWGVGSANTLRPSLPRLPRRGRKGS